MRKDAVLFFLAVFVLFAHGAVLAGTKGDDDYVQAEVREWFSYGDSSWRISFFDPIFDGDGESILDFEDIDAPVTLGTLRVKPGLYWLTLEGTFGSGDIASGTTIDTDQTDGLVWSRSESDTDGDVSIVDLKLAVRIVPWTKGAKSYLDGFIGYIYYREKLNISNGDQVIPDLGPFGGLNSTYEFTWESYPVGIEGNYSLIEKERSWLYDLSLTGSTSWGLVQYRGEGVWNLRSDFEQNPSFVHESNNGIASFTEFGVIYRPKRYISLGVGYQYYVFQAWNGIDTTFFSDGTQASTKLEEVSSIRHGPYISLSGQF